MLSLSIYSMPSFTEGYPAAAYVFFLFFLSLLSFNNVFLKGVRTPDVFNPVSHNTAYK
jgi:hypothetical protein